MRVIIKPIIVNDVTDEYVSYLNDSKVNQYLECRHVAQTRKSVGEYVLANIFSPNNRMFTIWVDSNRIGNIRLGSIDFNNKFADIGLVIWPDYWGKGYGSEAISLVKDYAFTTLNLHKVWAGCYTQNTGSIKAFQKAGFEIEYEIKNQYQLDGVYTDDIVLSAFNPKEMK